MKIPALPLSFKNLALDFSKNHKSISPASKIPYMSDDQKWAIFYLREGRFAFRQAVVHLDLLILGSVLTLLTFLIQISLKY